MRILKEGEKFNSFEFVKEVDKIKNKRAAVFLCKCGQHSTRIIYSIVDLSTKMCMACARKKGGVEKVTHNKTKHPLYRKWQDMKKRCYNKNAERYKNYGLNGICVCDEWKVNFISFYDWSITNGWVHGLELDRINVYGNYEPSNCRYITHAQQSYNKKNTVYIEYNGIKVCLIEWLDSIGRRDCYFKICQGVRRYNKSIEHYIDKFSLDTSGIGSI